MKRNISATPTRRGSESNTNNSSSSNGGDGDGDGDGSSRYNKVVNLPPWHQTSSSSGSSSSSSSSTVPIARDQNDENENTMNANISNDSYNGRRVKVNVIYYLSRGLGQSTDPPHLLQGYHNYIQSDGGLRLRDFKKWLGALRGEGVADAFAWSYKRRYKDGFIWHDLGGDNDHIQPLQLLLHHDHDQTGITTTTEYVLMGSELIIHRHHHHHHHHQHQHQQQHHHQDIELLGSKWSKWGPGVGGGAMNNAIQVQVMKNYNMDVGTQTGDSRRCSIDDDDDDDDDDGVMNDNDHDGVIHDDDDDGVMNDNDDVAITNDHNRGHMLHISTTSHHFGHGPITSLSGLATPTPSTRAIGDTRVIRNSGINLVSDRSCVLNEATPRINVHLDRDRTLNETTRGINVVSDRNHMLNEATPRINALSDWSHMLNEATPSINVHSDRNCALNEATSRINLNNNIMIDKKHHHHHKDQGHRCVRQGHHGGVILRQLLTCGNVDVVRKTDEVMMSYMSSHSSGHCDGILDTSSTPRSVSSSRSNNTTTTTKCHAKFFPNSKKTGSPVLGALGTRTASFPSSPYWKCNPGALILHSTRRRNGTSFSGSMSRDAASTVGTTFSDTRSTRTSCENKLKDNYTNDNELGSIRHTFANTNHTNNLYNNVQSCGSCQSPMLTVCSSSTSRRSSVRESDLGDHQQQHHVKTEGITLREIVNGPSQSKESKSTSGKLTMSLHESIMNEIRSNRLSEKTTNHKLMRAISNNMSSKMLTPHHDEDHQEEEEEDQMMMIMNNYTTMNDDDIRGEEQENGYGSLHNDVRSSNNSWRDLMFWSPRFNHKLDKRGDNRCFS